VWEWGGVSSAPFFLQETTVYNKTKRRYTYSYKQGFNMAQPVEYQRQFSFSDFSSESPSAQQPGQYLDLELNAVKQTTDQIRSNLELIQRDDGALANESVGVEQMKAEVNFGLNAVTDWLAGTVYQLNAGVWQDRVLYRCIVSHTANIFATDLAAAKWSELVDFDTYLTIAESASSNCDTKSTISTNAASAAQAAQAAAEAAQAEAEAVVAEVELLAGGVKVSANDTDRGYLNGKLVAGLGVTFTENNNGSNETLSVLVNHGVLSLLTQTFGRR
jgi:hypothetical protein